MSKIRINELARQLEVKSREVIDKLHELGIAEKVTHSSSIDEDKAETVAALLSRRSHLGGDAVAQRVGRGRTATVKTTEEHEAAEREEAEARKPGVGTRAPARSKPAPVETEAPEVKAEPAPAVQPGPEPVDENKPRAIPLRPPIFGRGAPIHPPITHTPAHPPSAGTRPANPPRSGSEFAAARRVGIAGTAAARHAVSSHTTAAAPDSRECTAARAGFVRPAAADAAPVPRRLRLPLRRVCVRVCRSRRLRRVRPVCPGSRPPTRRSRADAAALCRPAGGTARCSAASGSCGQVRPAACAFAHARPGAAAGSSRGSAASANPASRSASVSGTSASRRTAHAGRGIDRPIAVPGQRPGGPRPMHPTSRGGSAGPALRLRRRIRPRAARI